MKKLIRIAIASLLMATIVTGCGWHLRGTGQVADNISSVHISAQDRNSEFYRSLERAIISNDITVAENATEAQYSIVTLNNKSSRRTSSVSGGARASEYQLTESVDILILAADGTQLLPRTTLRATRYLDFDENEVQSKVQEAELLRKEMHRDLAQQVIRRLNAINNLSDSSPGTTAP
ncbi:MAG: LPS assembly lipoprotein LptE [Porticoccus sp.]|nr:LPS assembly lipoprotein LptE [Porticoccus sp.]